GRQPLPASAASTASAIACFFIRAMFSAALNARALSNKPHGYRCLESCSCRPCRAGDALPHRAAAAFFFRVVGELRFHYIAIERTLLVEQGRRSRAEAVRAAVAAGAGIVAHDPQRLVQRVVGHWHVIVIREQVPAPRRQGSKRPEDGEGLPG